MIAKTKELDAYTIAEFCRRHGISPAMFYKLRSQGEGPVVMRVGAKVLISKESAERWRRHLERGEQ